MLKLGQAKANRHLQAQANKHLETSALSKIMNYGWKGRISPKKK
jgi:hypothetical protein